MSMRQKNKYSIYIIPNKKTHFNPNQPKSIQINSRPLIRIYWILLFVNENKLNIIIGICEWIKPKYIISRRELKLKLIKINYNYLWMIFCLIMIIIFMNDFWLNIVIYKWINAKYSARPPFKIKINLK